MDKIDYRILECLKKNARMSTSAIGETINMSVSAVSERIRRLENSGVISRCGLKCDRKCHVLIFAFKPQQPGT